MTIEKHTSIDKVEVLEKGQIQVRQATRIVEDGEIISSSFHRHVLEPGANLGDQDAKVSAIAAAVWTDEVLTNWVTFKESQNN